MRIRGELVASLDATQTPGTLIHVSIGIILVPEGSSTTVQFNPVADAEAPWFMFEQFAIGYEEAVTDVVDMAGLSVFRKTIDVKAMRIVRPGIEAQVIVENTTLAS